MSRINQAGLDLIKSFEKCRLKAYLPTKKDKWTIGWGHTGDDVEEGDTISQEQADELLEEDLIDAEDAVDKLVDVAINENQHAALVSFVFNCGEEALETSHLLKHVNAEEWEKAADEFLKWDHQGGIVVPGLLRRRNAERELFLRETDEE
jgi:lysozyme